MALPSCSLWIFVARTDIPFMMHTIPHLVRMSNFPFAERVLAVDTAPLTGDKISRPGIGSLEELRDCTQKLQAAGIVDRIVDINYDTAYRDRLYRQHFGSPLRPTHNYKGYPILGSIFTIEECRSDYMVHFDSDMMLHQETDYSWIADGIALMQRHAHLMSVRPLAGPPTVDGTLYQGAAYEKHPDGFYQFNFFGSRVYLVDCQRFRKLFPFPIIWRPFRNRWLNKLPVTLQTLYSNLTGKGQLESWEIMVSQKIQATDYVRANLANSQAWTLHPKDRSPQFIAALPQIIEKIEAGIYPPEQAGYYDLITESWY
jgi:hypothetical protein